MNKLERIKTLFKNTDKKVMTNLVTGLLLGILLLIVSNTLFKNPDKDSELKSAVKTNETKSAYSENSYEELLESRIENSLSMIEGVGKVKVLITISYGKELVIAKNSTSDESSTKEVDAGGGSREISSKKVDEKKIIISSANGEEKPLILKEIEPKIEGVIVIAEGGNNIAIKNTLTKSIQSVFDVEAHKIQILKMK